MKAYLFAGQGSQVVGMGKTLLAFGSNAKEYLDMANDIVGYPLSQVMCEGSAEELRQTKLTQPAVFVYSVLKARLARDFKPDMVAGHSVGEFAALAAVRALSFADALRLVHIRAMAMQKVCEQVPSGMAAVLGLDDELTTTLCKNITDSTGEIVVTANYNCPGQLVISGTERGIEIATAELKAAGARSVVKLNVGGAFHSPVMEPARIQLAEIIAATEFKEAEVPVYQNTTATPATQPEVLKQNLIHHLTSPVYWTQTIENMILDGASQFIEVGPQPLLGAMVKRINRNFAPIAL